MTFLLLATLLTTSTTAGSVAPYQPLPLRDSRFQYRVSAPSGPATARTRTLLVQPAQGQKPAQSITLAGPAAQEPAANVMLRDVNFDGQPDLMITSNRGTVNNQYNYWLYDAGTQQFVLNPPMSNTLSGYEVTFDAAGKKIVTQSRFSCCEYQTRTYTFDKGALKLLDTKTKKTTAAGTAK